MQVQAQRSIVASTKYVARPLRSLRASRLTVRSQTTQTTTRTTKKEAIMEARSEVRDLIKSRHCSPILVRIAWHDSGTYDQRVESFPERGGANGSVRFYPEMEHAANAGLNIAVELLKAIADRHDGVSYADLFQMASAESIELAGGPHIPLRFGRTDACESEEKVPEGRLPAGEGPFPEGTKLPGDHLRKVFYRMGLDDQDIVALSGAHTLGRVHKDRSGFGQESTKYTKDGPGTPGGSSWTIDWLKFDNSYFTDVKRHDDPELVVLATDECLFADEGFRPYAEKYAQDQDTFFKDYVKSHLKLSELGVKWSPEPIEIE